MTADELIQSVLSGLSVSEASSGMQGGSNFDATAAKLAQYGIRGKSRAFNPSKERGAPGLGTRQGPRAGANTAFTGTVQTSSPASNSRPAFSAQGSTAPPHSTARLSVGDSSSTGSPPTSSSPVPKKRLGSECMKSESIIDLVLKGSTVGEAIQLVELRSNYVEDQGFNMGASDLHPGMMVQAAGDYDNPPIPYEVLSPPKRTTVRGYGGVEVHVRGRLLGDVDGRGKEGHTVDLYHHPDHPHKLCKSVEDD